jgi:hypothetical protein
LETDGISEWHPSFLQRALSLRGCSKRYERFCQRYHHYAKAAPKCNWNSRMLKRLVEKCRSSNRGKRISPGQQQLPFAFDIRLNQIPEKMASDCGAFRRSNGIHDGDRALNVSAKVQIDEG